DEAWAGIVAGDEQQNAEHYEELNADEHHPDAHTRLQRNPVNGIGLAFEARKRSSRVGEGVHADSEPCNPVASRNPDQAEGQNDDHPYSFVFLEHSEVEHDDYADKNFEHQDELTLGDQISFTRLVDKLRDLQHRPVNG